MNDNVNMMRRVEEYDKVTVALTIIRSDKAIIPSELYKAATDTLVNYLRDPFSIKDLK